MRPKPSPYQPKRSVREVNFGIIDYLCGRFQGLSPFEILNSDIGDVYDLYVDSAINQIKSENEKGVEKRNWVTSKDASWH